MSDRIRTNSYHFMPFSVTDNHIEWNNITISRCDLKRHVISTASESILEIKTDLNYCLQQKSLALITARKRSLGQGNIFYTCLSFCSQAGFCLSAWWDTPLTMHPPRTMHHPPPPTDHAPPSPQAQSMLGGTVNARAAILCYFWNCIQYGLLQVDPGHLKLPSTGPDGPPIFNT